MLICQYLIIFPLLEYCYTVKMSFKVFDNFDGTVMSLITISVSVASEKI